VRERPQIAVRRGVNPRPTARTVGPPQRNHRRSSAARRWTSHCNRRLSPRHRSGVPPRGGHPSSGCRRRRGCCRRAQHRGMQNGVRVAHADRRANRARSCRVSCRRRTSPTVAADVEADRRDVHEIPLRSDAAARRSTSCTNAVARRRCRPGPASARGGVVRERVARDRATRSVRGWQESGRGRTVSASDACDPRDEAGCRGTRIGSRGSRSLPNTKRRPAI
jgi:hypothetical protein